MRARLGWMAHRNPVEFSEDGYGLFIIAVCGGIFLTDRRAGRRVRKITECDMSGLYLLSSGLALLIFVYLVFALFFPEKF